MSEKETSQVEEGAEDDKKSGRLKEEVISYFKRV